MAELNAESQRRYLSMVEIQARRAVGGVKDRAILGGLMLAGAGLLALASPVGVAALCMTVLGYAGLFQAVRVTRTVAEGFALLRAKEDIANDPSGGKLRERAAKLKSRDRWTTFGGLGLAAAGIGLLVLAAPLAPAVLAAGALSLVVSTGYGGARKGAAEASRMADAFITTQEEEAAKAAPAAAPPAPGLSTVPSPAPAFGAAANDAKPAETAQKKPGWRSKFGL